MHKIFFSLSFIWAIIFELATMQFVDANSEFLFLDSKMYITVNFLDTSLTTSII